MQKTIGIEYRLPKPCPDLAQTVPRPCLSTPCPNLAFCPDLAQPCVGEVRISLEILNFLNFEFLAWGIICKDDHIISLTMRVRAYEKILYTIPRAKPKGC